MRGREWALVGFTLLMQASVGTLLAVVMTLLDSGRSSSGALDVPIALAVGTAGLALLVSVLHVGHPTRAWLALTNVRTSWLSREIAASILFFVVTSALYIQWGGASAPALSAASVILGVFVVYAMGRVYTMPSQTAWNTPLTLVAFFASTCLIGAVVVITTSAVDPAVLRLLAGVAAGLVGIQCLLAAVHVVRLPGEPAAAICALSRRSAIGLTAVRIGAAAVAVALLVFAMPAGAPIPMAPATLTIVFVLLAETIGRVLFYMGAASLRLS